MTKVEFLQELYNHLSGFSPAERDEIIQDFEEHFSAGIELGKSEEQICEELGTPYSCAMQYANTQQTSSAVSAGERHETEKIPSVKTSQTYQKPNFDRRNKTLWTLAFAFFVLCALGVYPTAVMLILSPIMIVLVAIFAVAAVPSGAMIGFIASLSVMFVCMGLLMFAIMTYLLKLCFRKAGL